MGNVEKQSEYATLIRKHNLQCYVGEQQMQRLKYLIDLCSTDLFGLDNLKLQELLDIKEYLEKQHKMTKRYRNWTIPGKVIDCKISIAAEGKITRIYMQPVHHNLKGHIICCLYPKEIVDIEKVIGNVIYVTGDLYKTDKELIVQVTNIKFRV
ncbi:MAG: hypothetical protein ACK5LC_05145 [Coprobacillaceae bacterium]